MKFTRVVLNYTMVLPLICILTAFTCGHNADEQDNQESSGSSSGTAQRQSKSKEELDPRFVTTQEEDEFAKQLRGKVWIGPFDSDGTLIGEKNNFVCTSETENLIVPECSLRSAEPQSAQRYFVKKVADTEYEILPEYYRYKSTMHTTLNGAPIYTPIGKIIINDDGKPVFVKTRVTGLKIVNGQMTKTGVDEYYVLARRKNTSDEKPEAQSEESTS